MSMWKASRSMGTFPKVCTASTWNGMPCSWAIAPISRAGWMVPISELACMIEIRMVSGRMARRTASGSTRPSPSTSR